MKRINLTDSTGIKTSQWFNIETAKSYKDDSYWNGHKHVSLKTDSEFTRETLYITKSNRFILSTFSSYAGSKDTMIEISQAEGIEWLISNGDFDTAEEIEKGVLEQYEV